MDQSSGLPFDTDGLVRLVKNNGWSIILAALFVIGSVGVVPKVYGQLESILAGVGSLQGQTTTIGEKFERLQATAEEGNRISCAQCWNGAGSEDEIKRCSCNPQ